MTADRTEENGNGAGETAVAVAAKRAITPKGFKLPQIGFADLKPLVQAMVDLSGPASRNLIFDNAGAAASGGTADTKWAALGYYGLRQSAEAEDGKHEVTERGEALVSGDADREREAKQQALVSTGFRPIIARFSARPVNKTSLAGLLREDFSVPATKAESAADLLVDLATEAGFVADGTFKPAPIEAAMAAVPEPSTGARGRRTGSSPAPNRGPRSPAPKQPKTEAPARSVDGEGSGGSRPASEGQAGPFALAPVQVVVNVDASKLTAEQVTDLVRALREPPPMKTTS